MTLDRVLSWADEDDRSEQAAKVRGLQLFLQLHIAARLWFICFPLEALDVVDWRLPIGMATAASIGLLVGLRPGWARAGVAITVATMFVKLAVTFPMSSNHFMLELLNVVLLLVLGARDREDDRLMLIASRAITAIVIFHTGLQKLLYGTYFKGQFLAYQVATKETFGDVFQFLLPAEELSRLVNSHPERFGSGPFEVEAPLFLLASNGVYVFELVAPFLLLAKRTRPFATLAVIGFMVFVQAGARELFFGIVLVNLLLLFFTRAWNLRLLPLFAAVYVALFTARFWLFPEFTFH